MGQLLRPRFDFLRESQRRLFLERSGLAQRKTDFRVPLSGVNRLKSRVCGRQKLALESGARFLQGYQILQKTVVVHPLSPGLRRVRASRFRQGPLYFPTAESFREFRLAEESGMPDNPRRGDVGNGVRIGDFEGRTASGLPAFIGYQNRAQRTPWVFHVKTEEEPALHLVGVPASRTDAIPALQIEVGDFDLYRCETGLANQEVVDPDAGFVIGPENADDGCAFR